MTDETQRQHLEKYVCEGFDKTDWSIPVEHNDFTLRPPPENPRPHNATWTFHESNHHDSTYSRPRYTKKRVKVYGSLGRESAHKGAKGPRKYTYSPLKPSSEIDQLRSDIKAIVIIGAIAVIMMFVLYFSIVISFML